MAREIEEFQAKVTAKDEASKVIDEAAKKGEKFEKEEYEAELKLDGGKFEATAEDLKSDIGDILDQARKKPELDLDASKAKGELDSLQSKMGEVQGKGEGLTGGAVNSLSDLTGPLGDVSGKVSEFGQAFVGAAELAAPALSKVGLDVGRLTGLLGVGGAAVGAVLFFWDQFNQGAEDAKKRLEEVKEAQLALASGDIRKSVELLEGQYDKYRDTLEEAGISQQAFAKMITEGIPLTEAQTKALGNNEGMIGRTKDAIDKSTQAWKEADTQIVASQSTQFEMAKAIGATTQQLLDMASTAVGPVRDSILTHIATVEGIPASKMTEILTDTNPDDVKQVEAELDALAKDRDSTVNVDADTSEAEEKLRSFMSSIASQTRVIPISAAPSAAPTVAPAVAPSAAGRAAPTTIVTNNVTVNVPVGTPTAEVGRFVADALDAHERRSGSRRRVG